MHAQECVYKSTLMMILYLFIMINRDDRQMLGNETFDDLTFFFKNAPHT